MLSLLKAAKVAIMAGITPVVLASWAAFGLVLFLIAIGRWRRRLDWHPAIVTGLVTTAAAVLIVRYVLTDSATPIAMTIATLLVCAVARAMGRLDGTLVETLWMPAAIVTLVMPIAWWAIAPGRLDVIRVTAFTASLVAVYAGLRDRSTTRNWQTPIAAAYLMAGLFLLLNVAALSEDQMGLAWLAHHWGAYIGPAQHVLAGLVPFYDVPMQYGLGPTSLIAGGCAVVGCWQGLHLLITGTTLVLALLLLLMVRATSQRRGAIWQVTAAGVTFVAVFLWPGGLFGSSPIITPSTGGLRFLPVTLVAALLFFERPRWAGVALAVSILWSPEVAVWALVIFVLHETMRVGLWRAVWRGAAIAGGTSLAGTVAFRSAYGLWPQWDVIAEYLVHVPNRRAVNPSGPFLILVAVMALGAWLVCRSAATRLARRRDLIAVTLLFVTTSYFLGRSHPGNIAPLIPFMVLVAFRVLDRHADSLSRLPAFTTIGLAASVATLALSSWQVVPWGHGFDSGMQSAVRTIDAIDADMQSIRARIVNTDHLGIADFDASLNRSVEETIVWTPMDPASLWAFMPSDRRRIYIARAAARLRRPGWAIFDQDHLDLLDDLRVAYDVVESSAYWGVTDTPDGTRSIYTVVKLVPRGAR